MQFTAQQEAFLAHDPSRRARLLAGPGTGKTTVAVEFARRLHQLAIPPRIKFMTFTRAATAQLAAALFAEIEPPSTLHAFAISAILRNHGIGLLFNPLRIADHWEHDKLVLPHLANLSGFSVPRTRDLLAEKSAMWQSLDEPAGPNFKPAERAAFNGAYDEQRRTHRYTLTDELPDLLRKALIEHGVGRQQGGPAVHAFDHVVQGARGEGHREEVRLGDQ